MNIDDFSTLIRFNFWANARICDVCEYLTADEFMRNLTPDPGWGSLRGILVHTLDTEYGWRTSLQSLDDTIINATDFPNLSALKTRWEIEKRAWFNYMTTLNNECLQQVYKDPQTGEDAQTGPKVWQTLMHVVAHSIQHRSEAAFILSSYGHSPGELDLDRFLSEEAKLSL